MKHVMIDMYKIVTWNKNMSAEHEILFPQNDHWDDVLDVLTHPSIMNITPIWIMSNHTVAL